MILFVGVMERPITTCRVGTDNVHEYVLKEVDRDEFHRMLLNTVRAECSQSTHTTKLKSYRKGQDYQKGQGQRFYFLRLQILCHDNLDKNSIH